MLNARHEIERLATAARNWQHWAAQAHASSVRLRDRGALKLAVESQSDAQGFAKSARDRLFVLLNLQPEA